MYISRKSEGLNLAVWTDQVTETYNQQSTLFPLEPGVLTKLYHQDYSIEEALLKLRSREGVSAYMELHVQHEHGRYSATFRTEQQARAFFSKFPEIRKAFIL